MNLFSQLLAALTLISLASSCEIQDVENLMKAEFTHFGAAQYGTYWTQVFAKPRN